MPAQPWARVVLSGAATHEMLTRNLHSQEIKVDAELLERQAPLPEDPETCRRTRSALNWTYSAVLVDLV
ncbi:MAG: hypothetical protein ABI323_09690 [Solirubrobacteraceae bacterium]